MLRILCRRLCYADSVILSSLGCAQVVTALAEIPAHELCEVDNVHFLYVLAVGCCGLYLRQVEPLLLLVDFGRFVDSTQNLHCVAEDLIDVLYAVVFILCYIHPVIRSDGELDIATVVTVHRSVMVVTVERYRLVPCGSAVYKCGELVVHGHLCYRLPALLGQNECIGSVTALCSTRRTDVPIVRRLHETHLNRRNLVAGDAALTDTCDLHGVVDAVERCAVVDELREVALMEHCTDVRLQAA